MVDAQQRPAELPEVQRLEKQLIVEQAGVKAIDILAEGVPLSRQKLKQAMEKGAIWLNKSEGGRRRLRRAKTLLYKGDVLELNYDAHILAAEPPLPRLIADKQAYSVWYKPAKMLSQGSKFADHCAITRWIEKNHEPRRTTYLVHRLDRAASGLILIAHDRSTAAKLSKLFSTRKILKRYKVGIDGEFSGDLPVRIEVPLDGKAAESVILSSSIVDDQSELTIEIKTGRKHQIRRHLSEQGWPVSGDKLYGEPGARGELKLKADYLSFICPLSGVLVTYQLD